MKRLCYSFRDGGTGTEVNPKFLIQIIMKKLIARFIIMLCLFGILCTYIVSSIHKQKGKCILRFEYCGNTIQIYKLELNATSANYIQIVVNDSLAKTIKDNGKIIKGVECDSSFIYIIRRQKTNYSVNMTDNYQDTICIHHKLVE